MPSYILEGRSDSSLPWSVIAADDLEWASWSPLPGRNEQGLPINSSYESGDMSRIFTEVPFYGNSDAYLEYKVSFESRGVDQTYVQFGEVELPGMLLP